jgi:hypothetical protein
MGYSRVPEPPASIIPFILFPLRKFLSTTKNTKNTKQLIAFEVGHRAEV